jgi:hypothetical protein
MSITNDDIKIRREKIITLMRETIASDTALREKYQIGDKFRFVRDRLKALLQQLEQSESKEEQEKESIVETAEDETLVYVYLYNSQGLLLQTWINMLTPKLFYEYSVNRPIYLHKSQIEKLINSKTNCVQHAFLTVVVKKNEILQTESSTKDVLGNSMAKVKEGSLRYEKFVVMTHNNQEYKLSAGRLVKKI